MHQRLRQAQRSVVERLLECIEQRVGAKRRRNLLIVDAPGEGVDDEGYVHETAPRRHVGQVG